MFEHKSIIFWNGKNTVELEIFTRRIYIHQFRYLLSLVKIIIQVSANLVDLMLWEVKDWCLIVVCQRYNSIDGLKGSIAKTLGQVAISCL